MEDKPEADSSSISNGSGIQFHVAKWDAVVVWSWDLLVDNCAICRNLITDTCIECQAAQVPANNDVCTAAWGACNHAYHLHCISRWVISRAVCPLCNRQWEYSKFGK